MGRASSSHRLRRARERTYKSPVVDESDEQFTARFAGGTTTLYSVWHSRKEGDSEAVVEIRQLEDGLSIKVELT